MYPLQNRWTVLRYLQYYENFSERCTHLILPETALFSPAPTFAKEPLKETHTGAIILDEKQVVYVSNNDTGSKKQNKKKDTLESIIEKVNERFDGDFTESDRVIIEGIYRMFMDDKDVKKFKKYASDNSTEMFVQSLFPDKFKEIVTQCFLENNESFQKLFNDPDFYQKVQDVMANELYKNLRNN